MATIASTAIWAFAIIVAANQVGIAQTLVNTLVIGTVAMLVLALGLSFGLGAKDTAGEIVRKWYGDVKDAKPKARACCGRSIASDSTQMQGSSRSDLARTQV